MVEDLYFIKVIDQFSTGLLQRSSSSSRVLITKDLTKAKFFRNLEEVENYVEKLSLNYPQLRFIYLSGSMEVSE